MRGRWKSSELRTFTATEDYKMRPVSLLSLALHDFAFSGVRVVATSTTSRESSSSTAVEAVKASQQYAADLVGDPENYFARITSLLFSPFSDPARRNISIWEMVQLAVVCGVVPCLWLIRSKSSGDSGSRSQQQNQGTRSTNEAGNTQMNGSHTSTRVESASMSRSVSILLLLFNANWLSALI
jgi:hypothetical protein